MEFQTPFERGNHMMENPLEPKPDKTAKAQFILNGFTQSAGIRIYAFECLADGRRLNYTVAVNLALIPTYGIRIQDLPLLCRELLLQRTEPDEESAMVFAEPQMRSHAEKIAILREETAQRKKAPRQPANATPGAAWRTNNP